MHLNKKLIKVTQYEQNAGIYWCEASKEAIFTDPGGSIDTLVEIANQLKLNPKFILLTHGHFDHICGVEQLQKRLQIPIYGPHIADKSWIAKLPEISERMGVKSIHSFTPDKWLSEKDQIQFGEINWQILHCPGHSAGSLVYHQPQLKILISGDVIFKGGMGRTDLPGGNHQELLDSILAKLFILDDEVRFFPGHGLDSTIGWEKLHNPFFQ